MKHALAILVVAAGLGVPLLLWWQATPAEASERPPVWEPQPEEGPPARKDRALPSSPPPRQADPLPEAALLLEIDPETLPRTSGPGLVLSLTGPKTRRVSVALEGALLELPGLAPGPWRLVVAPGPLGALAEPLWERRIDLQPGERHRAALPPLELAVLEGQVAPGSDGQPPPQTGQSVRLFTQGGWLEERLDSSGRFRFTRLLPGKALLLFAGGPTAGLAGASREVTLLPGQTTQVRLTPRKP